jgi:serine/threonine protein kinase
VATKLRPQLGRFFDYIRTKNEGDVVSQGDIVSATKWAPATFDAHRLKKALDPFLVPTGSGTFRVRRDGASILQDDVTKAFTQIRPSELILTLGLRVSGAKGDYQLISEMGRGAVAHVWKASRVLDRQEYAVKVMNPRTDLLEPSTLDNVRRRFAREAKNGMKLAHENIVTYIDAGELKGQPFLVMELADASLAARLKTSPLNLAEALEVIEACAAALKYLHAMSCVHRDVKPHNILQFGSRYVLGDLGIVRWSDMNALFVSAGTITKAAVQLGSWHYMAPEQRAIPHDAVTSSDIYALGVSWYEILTGITPDPAAVAAQVFPDPSSTSAVNSLIRKMLKFKPEERPDSDELLITIGTIRANLSV